MFQYRLLEIFEIHLLEIMRSSSDHDVVGYKIAHFQLDQAPEYETVSYVWGESHASRTITLIDGSILPVTTSISASLSPLTKACRTKYLWIDQLTIDQRNTSERNAQVKIKGEIFRRSSRCLIWLGSDVRASSGEDESNRAHSNFFQGMYRGCSRYLIGLGTDARPSFVEDAVNRDRQIGQVVSDFFRLFQNEDSSVRADLLQSPITETKGLLLPWLSLASDDLLWFFEHEWFRRAWVFQEFVLAPKTTFLFGDFQVPGEVIVRSFVGGWARGNHFSDTFKRNLCKDMATRFHDAPIVKFMIAAVEMQNSLLGLQQASENTEETEQTERTNLTPRRYCGSNLINYESVTYANTLDDMGSARAHDDRDHVYALLGLAPCLLKHMQVDYTLSVEEVFAAMMKALVRESKSLDFFAKLPFESDISKSKLRLPSWTPNWNYSASNINILSYDCQFNASGDGYGLPSVTKCKHMDDLGAVWSELHVAGKIIDTVSFVLPSYSPYQALQAQHVDFKTDRGRFPWEISTLQIMREDLSRRSSEAAQNITIRDILRTLLMDGVRWAMIDMLGSGISPKNMYREKRVILDVSHMEKVEAVVTVLTEHKDPGLDTLPYHAGRHTLHELSRVQYRRRLAYCAAGRLALVPDLVEKGDCIAILHGSRTPVVLRARPDGKYAAVGRCYYDGAMYGELADLDDDAASIFTLI